MLLASHGQWTAQPPPQLALLPQQALVLQPPQQLVLHLQEARVQQPAACPLLLLLAS